jgi:DNA-binding transcriptional ArsR family regulator
MDIQPAFRALADPTRREILKLLGETDMSVAEVTAQFDMTRAAVRKHLGVLQQGDLIRVRRRGRETLNTLHADGLRPVLDWLGFFDQFWDDRLSALKTAIEKDKT